MFVLPCLAHFAQPDVLLAGFPRPAYRNEACPGVFRRSWLEGLTSCSGGSCLTRLRLRRILRPKLEDHRAGKEAVLGSWRNATGWVAEPMDIYFLAVLEAGSPRPGCQPVLYLARGLFLACKWIPPYGVLTWPFLGVWMWRERQTQTHTAVGVGRERERSIFPIRAINPITHPPTLGPC